MFDGLLHLLFLQQFRGAKIGLILLLMLGFADPIGAQVVGVSLSSGAGRAFVVGDGTVAVATLTVGADSANVILPSSNGGGIQLRIPDGLRMRWDVGGISFGKRSDARAHFRFSTAECFW